MALSSPRQEPPFGRLRSETRLRAQSHGFAVPALPEGEPRPLIRPFGPPSPEGEGFLGDQWSPLHQIFDSTAQVRDGWILKEGVFGARERDTQRLLKPTSLVTFLFGDKKVTSSPLLSKIYPQHLWIVEIFSVESEMTKC